MNLVLVSDNQSLNHEIETIIRDGFSGDLTIVPGDSLLECGELPSYDFLIVERNTWQEHFSMYKYFGLIDSFENTSLLCVSRGRKANFLKGRLGKKDVFVSLPFGQDDFMKGLEECKTYQEQLRSIAAASIG